MFSFQSILAFSLTTLRGVIYEVITEGSAAAAASKTDASNGVAEDAKKGESKKKKKPVDADEDRSNDPSVGVGR